MHRYRDTFVVVVHKGYQYAAYIDSNRINLQIKKNKWKFYNEPKKNNIYKNIMFSYRFFCKDPGSIQYRLINIDVAWAIYSHCYENVCTYLIFSRGYINNFKNELLNFQISMKTFRLGHHFRPKLMFLYKSDNIFL